MKYKKHILFLALPLLLICSFFFWIFFLSDIGKEDSAKDNTKKNEAVSSELNEDDLKPESPNKSDDEKEVVDMSVYVIGDNDFVSSDHVHVIHADIKDDFSKNRFILLPIDYELNLDKQKILYDWILKGNVVGFFGENIDTSLIPDKFNMAIPVAEKPIGTDIDFNFMFYGYGYSEEEERYTPIFHLVDSTYDDYYDSIYEILHEFLLDKNDF